MTTYPPDGNCSPAHLSVPEDPSRRPRALSEIGYNSLVSDTGTTSSSDDGSGNGKSLRKIPPEQARTLLGVSIGREQSRLTNPKTPAPEKQAAIERAGGFFGDGALDDSSGEVSKVGEDGELEDLDEQDEDEVRAEQSTDLDGAAESREEWRDTPVGGEERPSRPARSAPKTNPRLPSPWRAVPRKFQRAESTRQYLRDGLMFSRRRASSGPESTLGSLQKAFMSSLPSVPKNFSLSSPFSQKHEEPSKEDELPRKRPSRSSSFLGTNFQWPSWSGGSSPTKDASSREREQSAGETRLRRVSTPMDTEEAEQTVPELPSRPQLQSLRARTSYLKRSASDDSLTTARTLSRVSSLGDDSRFEHVSDQVNSRIKAIRDSWQDSSIKLPSMPSIANLSRSGSVSRRQQQQSIPYADRDVGTTMNGTTLRTEPVEPFPKQPNHFARNAAHENKAETPHPHFERACSRLEGDLVILGGYRGSILRSAQPPHRQLWVPIKVGLNIRKVDLELGLGEEDDELASKKVIPGGMLTHIGPVDISRRLFKRLRSCDNARSGKLRVHDYGYDWRLDPAYLSNQLQKYLESLPCNRPGVPKHQRGAIVIAHSLGGLITRHAVNQRPDLFKGVIYAGVPNTCVNILGPLRNGDDVLLSSRVLTAQVNFTIRTSFALLPLNGRCFFDKQTREEYPVDFFDPQTWIDYRLSPCVARPLPPLTKPPEPASLGGYVSSFTKALPALALPNRRASLSRPARASNPPDPSKASTAAGIAAEPNMSEPGTQNTSDAVRANNNIDASHASPSDSGPPSISTTVTLPREACLDYLTRMLASVKKFKQELAFHPPHQASNIYPPTSVIYGKSTPTVYGARVDGREAIKHADAFDALAFASGDGVVLAKAAMVPEGYSTVKGGVVSSERGHVTILGDLEGMGRCLNAVVTGRRQGMGLGGEEGGREE